MSAQEVESDLFAESRHMKEDWDDVEYRAQQLAGALLETICPECQMRVGACKIDGPDDRWLEVECPACRHRWIEET